jgi:hypothetical protein
MGAKQGPFCPSLRSRYVRRGKNEPIRDVKAGILMENGREPSPTVVGNQWNDRKPVGIKIPRVAQGSHLENVRLSRLARFAPMP